MEDIDLNQQIGGYLKRARINKKLNQEQAAGLIGVGQKAYSNYENGREVSIGDIVKLVEALDAPKDELVKILFPRVEQVVLTGLKEGQYILSSEDYSKVRTSLKTLDSIFSPSGHSKKDSSQDPAKMDEVPLGRIKSRKSIKEKGKRTGISR